MSKKEVIIYKLNEEEKNILKLELDKETITRYLLQMKWNFNQTYQLMMNIFKKIFNSKKNNNILAKELISHIEELEKYEQMVLKIYKIIMIYLKIINCDMNNTDICIEFENEQEKKKLIDDLSNRKKLLEEFKSNMEKLERIKRDVNSIHEKFTNYLEMDNTD